MAGGKRKSQHSKTNSVSSNQSKEHFNESDGIILNEINQTMKHSKEEMKILKFELNQAKTEIVQVKKENERLKQAIDLNIFANDDLDQYNRRENIRIYGVPEIGGKKDDGEDVLFQVAEELNMELDEWDIQRCHRLGENRSPAIKQTLAATVKKTRQIITRFSVFKKKKRISVFHIKAEKKRKVSKHLFDKDLTQLRCKLLNYVKTKCGNKFVMCHTYNEKIRKNVARRRKVNYCGVSRRLIQIEH